MKRARPRTNGTAFSNKGLWDAMASYMKDPTTAEAVHGPIAQWDVSGVTDMRRMFFGAVAFNGDLSKWDVSSVTDMQGMFSGADAFNGDLSKWDVSSVTDMRGMFCGAYAFDGDLSAWDVSSVTDMLGVFERAVAFGGRMSDGFVARMQELGERRSAAVLWRVARRRFRPWFRARRLALWWLERASRPTADGRAPPGAVAAFADDF